MRNFPTINDVEQLMKKKEIEEESREVPKHMQFNINFHLPEDERNLFVQEDIALEYPEIPEWMRYEIASVEEPIGRCHEDYDMFYKDELRIYRLFNMLQILYHHKNSKDIYEKAYYKAYEDIKESYKIFLEHFTYANPGEQKVSMITRTIKEFTGDKEIEIPKY